MNIGPHSIGPGHPPFIICELGANHGGDLAVAKELIATAKMVGADAVKFQCYGPTNITIDCDRPEFILRAGPWKGRRLWDLYAAAQTPLSWFPQLAAHAAKVGITWFASVFDRDTVDLCDSLGAPAFKIASAEITDIPLIRYAASKGKSLIISTGMASEDEIADAGYAVLRSLTAVPYIQLHCISGYPSKLEEANLSRIAELAKFGTPVGLSDHSLSLEVPIAATALGATIIEKHLRVSTKSEDSEFSLWPNEFRMMADAVRRTWHAMQPSTPASEAPSRQARRSLYVVQNMKAGDPFTPENIRSIRPAGGLPPKLLPEALGKQATKDIPRGTPLAKDLIA